MSVLLLIKPLGKCGFRSVIRRACKCHSKLNLPSQSQCEREEPRLSPQRQALPWLLCRERSDGSCRNPDEAKPRIYSGFIFLSKFTTQKRPSFSKSQGVRGWREARTVTPKSHSFRAREQEGNPNFLGNLLG